MRKHIKGMLYLLFSLSGFCALVYEILWTRYLSLTFGTTITAVSIVAATFMGGLALGSYIIGRYADHGKNLLRIYAFLELGIALTALLFPPTLKLVETVYVMLNHAFPDSATLNHVLHLSFAALLLLPPTICMGGTFPLMCRFFARQKSGGQIGRLYALNTLGATSGAFACGYILVPTLGLPNTGYLAVGLNLLIFALVYWYSCSLDSSAAAGNERATQVAPPILAGNHRVILFAIGMVGFLSLAYEILWTRVFLLFLGNTTYAFSMMLSAFLVGIACGGAFYARIVRPDLDEKSLFVRLSIMMGFSVIATVPFYDRLANLFMYAHQASGERWWHLSLLSYLVVLAVMLIPTVVSGALLPAAVAIINPGKGHTGEGVGLVVLTNTAGAVLGSLVAGFALIPLFGLQGSFRVLAALNLLMGLALFLGLRPGGAMRVTCPTIACAGLLLAVIPFQWDAAMMNSGVYVYAPKYLKMGGLEKILALEKVLTVIEGSETTVAVHSSLDDSNRFFTVNGKTDGGTGRDMSTQILVGQLPLLLHPKPGEVLVIGLGTGITLHGMADHPVTNIDCAEISPEVVKSYDYFTRDNGDPLKDPKVKLFVDDGRNLLFTTTKRYDVIVSEPSNPWQSGNANLFTDEFYKLALERLAPNGIFCQWIGLYDITPDNLRVMCNTFLRNFPRSMVFKAGTDLIIVGAKHEIAFDYAGLRQRMAIPGVNHVLGEIDIKSPGELIAAHYLYSEDPLLQLAQGAEVNTDDMPILEFSARYNLGSRTMGEFQEKNMRLLTEAKGKIFLPVTNLGTTAQEVAFALRDLGKGYAKAGKQNEAENFMRKAASVEIQARNDSLAKDDNRSPGG